MVAAIFSGGSSALQMLGAMSNGGGSGRSNAFSGRSQSFQGTDYSAMKKQFAAAKKRISKQSKAISQIDAKLGALSDIVNKAKTGTTEGIKLDSETEKVVDSSSSEVETVTEIITDPNTTFKADKDGTILFSNGDTEGSLSIAEDGKSLDIVLNDNEANLSIDAETNSVTITTTNGTTATVEDSGLANSINNFSDAVKEVTDFKEEKVKKEKSNENAAENSAKNNSDKANINSYKSSLSLNEIKTLTDASITVTQELEAVKDRPGEPIFDPNATSEAKTAANEVNDLTTELDKALGGSTSSASFSGVTSSFKGADLEEFSKKMGRLDLSTESGVRKAKRHITKAKSKMRKAQRRLKSDTRQLDQASQFATSRQAALSQTQSHFNKIEESLLIDHGEAFRKAQGSPSPNGLLQSLNV